LVACRRASGFDGDGLGIEAHQIADRNRLLEHEMVHRHGGDAAAGDANG
jgi:hypothetical protein